MANDIVFSASHALFKTWTFCVWQVNSHVYLKFCLFTLLFSSKHDDAKKFKKSPGRFKSKKRCVSLVSRRGSLYKGQAKS